MIFDLALADARGESVVAAQINDAAPSDAAAADKSLRVRGVVTGEGAPDFVVVTTRRAAGEVVDSLRVAAFTIACEAGTAPNATCFESLPFRVVIDLVDRDHPSFAGGAILGGLSDSLVLEAGAAGAASRVFPIRGSSPTRDVTLRVVSVRISEDGDPAVGDWPTIAREVERSQSIWSVCGIDVAAPSDELVATPAPTSFLLSVGCESPAPAMGGTFAFRAAGRDVSVPIDAGMTPRGAARRVASKLESMGLRPSLVDNPRPQGTALGSTDILVRDASGRPVSLSAPAKGLPSTDAALSLCVPEVDLSDGLRHFTDVDAIVGTMEERLLIHGLADDDPRTIDVLVVPSFRGESRIGETFIGQGRGVLRNLLILDRAAFRVAHASYTMAHELGHIILDQPGHTDDFGNDTPTSLMDADAANPSAFGPRRLSAEECAGAHRPRSEDEVLMPRAIE